MRVLADLAAVSITPMAPFTSQPALAFAQAAREFCAFIEEAPKLALPTRLIRARRHLLALYSAGADLPLVPPAADVPSRRAPEQPAGWRTFETFDYYWEVFDPYMNDEPVNASLSDDLLDVYKDIHRGLQHWDDDNKDTAVWEWRFLFEAHWGDHAADALRALHRACVRAHRVDTGSN